MPRHFKRLGTAKKSKLTKNPLEKLRGIRTLDTLRLVAAERQRSTLPVKDPETGAAAAIILEHQPFRRKGHWVFAADFSRYPPLAKGKSPGFAVFGAVFVDSRIPAEFQNIIIDHEIRESILKRAQYEKRSGNESMAHWTAVQREKKDLKRSGKMQEYLKWLKKNHPELYRDRIKRWRRIEKK